MAFTPGNAKNLLEQAAGEFVNHPRAVGFEGGGVVASRLYRWFRDDFGGSEEAVLRHLRHYAAPKLQARLVRVREIERYDFDWSLNDAAGIHAPR